MKILIPYIILAGCIFLFGVSLVQLGGSKMLRTGLLVCLMSIVMMLCISLPYHVDAISTAEQETALYFQVPSRNVSMTDDVCAVRSNTFILFICETWDGTFQVTKDGNITKVSVRFAYKGVIEYLKPLAKDPKL